MRKKSVITIGIAILASTLMLVSGFSSVASSPSSPPSTLAGGQGGHAYFVTVKTGNQSYSYYEEVKGNTVVKTWSAASTPSSKQREGVKNTAITNNSPNYVARSNSLQGPLSVNSQTGGSSNAGHESSYLSSVSGSFNFKPNSAPDFSISPSSGSMDIGQSLTVTQTHKIHDSLVYLWASTDPTFQTDSFQLLTISTTGGPGTQITYALTSPITPGIWYLEVSKSGNQDTPGEGEGSIVSNTVEIVVNTALVAPIVSPSSTTLDQGQSVTLTLGTPTTGTPAYTYQWYEKVDSGSYSTVGTDSTTYTFSTSTSTTLGTYSFYATITDSATTPETVSSATVTVSVNQSPTVSLSVDQSAIDVGQTATLTASASNGYGTYTYNWLYEGPGVTSWTTISDADSSSSTYQFSSSSKIYSEPGTYTFEVTVTDGNGVTSSHSYTVPITVNADPTVSISPTSSSFDIGGSQSFSATTDSGTGPYASITAYKWQLGTSSAPSGSSLGSLKTFDFTSGTSGTATSTGLYYLWVTVTDSNGGTAASSATVTVNQLPAIDTQPSSYSIDSGQSFASLSSIVEYGTGSYTWQWYSGTPGSGTEISGATGTATSATYKPSSAGSYYVVFTDGNGNSVTSDAATVTVNADPTISVTPSSPQTLPTEGSLNIYADISYTGTNSLSVEWYSNSGDSTTGATDTTISGLTFTPSTSSPGTTYYFATVTDGDVPNYSSDSNIVEVTVSASSIPLGVDITSPSIGDVSNGSSSNVGVQSGTSFTISFTGFGGTPSYTAYLYFSSTDSSETTLKGITGLTQETLTSGSYTTTTTGYYYTLVKDSASPIEWAFASLHFYTQSSGGGGGGGGGCVLYGTLISISPNQSIPVQDLRVGQQLLSYNTADGQLVEENITAISVTNVTSIFDINNGLLYVSGATDQPIYVMLPNGTQEWVMVGNLTTYDKVLSPINGSWIPVNSIQILTGNFTVYDITGSSIFYSGGYLRSDYIANGILLDLKLN